MRLPRSKAAIIWSDWYWLWQLYLAGGCAVAVAIVFIPAGTPRGNPYGAAAALLGLTVWALTYGRYLRADHRARSFVAVIVALWTIALSCDPGALSALPMVYPLVFTSLPLGWAIAVTSTVNLLPLAIFAAQGALDPVGLPLAAAMALLACLLSPVIGVWITGTAVQSEKRAVLLEELSATRAEAARLSHQAGIAAERARLAREIHDTLAQGFTSIVALAQTLESELQHDPAAAHRHVALIRTTAADNLAEARTMVAALTPTALSSGSLTDSVRRLGERLTAETGIEVTLLNPEPPPALSTAEEVILLRAAQEALTNVRKHAGASAVTVELSRHPDHIRLTVTDNGSGFDAPQDGFGLRGMRARTEQLGGTMSVRTRPGTGTTIQIDLPT